MAGQDETLPPLLVRCALIWLDPDLSTTEKAVAISIVLRIGSKAEGVAFASRKTLARDWSCSDREITRAFAALEKRTWFTTTSPPGKTKQWRWHYTSAEIIAGVEDLKARLGRSAGRETLDGQSIPRIAPLDARSIPVNSTTLDALSSPVGGRGHTVQSGWSGSPGTPDSPSTISTAPKHEPNPCTARQTSGDAGTEGCEGLGAGPTPIPPPASPAREEVSTDHSAPLNGAIEAVRKKLREAAQLIGQDLSDADLDQAIARAAKESGTAKTIQAANEVLAKARKRKVQKVDGALVSFARNAKPNGRNGQPSAPTSSAPPAFEEWLSAGTAVVHRAALADLKAGQEDTTALNAARQIYDKAFGGNR